MSGRVALVTGGSGGIGAATVRALVHDGRRVAIGYRTGEAPARRLAADLCADFGAEVAMVVAVSVEDPDSVHAAFDAVEAGLGPVEILVNNAGIAEDGLLVRMSDDAWGRVLAVDLTGAFHTIRRAAPKMMRARFGRIVNVSSVVAHLGAPGQANYAAAKAGLVGLTRSVARELGRRSVTANVVAPGPITTPMTDDLGDDWLATVTGMVPLARPGTPEEAAAAIAFLASDAAGYITGVVLPVDGGIGMGT